MGLIHITHAAIGAIARQCPTALHATVSLAFDEEARAHLLFGDVMDHLERKPDARQRAALAKHDDALRSAWRVWDGHEPPPFETVIEQFGERADFLLASAMQSVFANLDEQAREFLRQIAVVASACSRKGGLAEEIAYIVRLFDSQSELEAELRAL